MLPNVKVRKLIYGTFFRDDIAFAVSSDSDLLNFLLGLFFWPDHAAEQWRAPPLGRSQETQLKPETTQLKH